MARFYFFPGTRILTGGEDGTIRIVATESGTISNIFKTDSAVRSVSFWQDETSIILGSADRKVRVLTIETGKIEILFEHEDSVNMITATSDGKRVKIINSYK